MHMPLPPGKMYNFFIDDNIFFFDDLIRREKKSIFDCFYLAGLKAVHEEYGTKFTLNGFYRNWHDPSFDLSLVDDRFRREFQENASWLRFAFHGFAEFPECPYSRACPEKLPEHYAQWHDAMCRIAGPECLIAPVIFHYYDAAPECLRFMRARGQRFLAVRREPETDYLPDFDLFPVKVDATLNRFFADLDGIRACLEGAVESGKEKILIGSHEQYAWRHYENYIPEYFDEIRTACEVMKKHGYRSVYFNEPDETGE